MQYSEDTLARRLRRGNFLLRVVVVLAAILSVRHTDVLTI